jgi:hypothetical protein
MVGEHFQEDWAKVFIFCGKVKHKKVCSTKLKCLTIWFEDTQGKTV